MISKISAGGAGSSGGLVNYLEKQEKGQWFNHEREDIGPLEVTTSMDVNKKNLGKEDEKFFQIIISPSQKELTHINNDAEKLKDYTRDVMGKYAQNFNKGIDSKNLIWYAKIEKERAYNFQDKEVKNKDAKKGELKEGLQTHVHILVSRTENLDKFKELKQAGDIDRKNPLKLSPNTHHRNTELGAVKGGFDRCAFKEATEKAFDKKFDYERPLTETFNYANTMHKGNQEERINLREQAIQEEYKKGKEKEIDQSVKKDVPLKREKEGLSY